TLLVPFSIFVGAAPATVSTYCFVAASAASAGAPRPVILLPSISTSCAAGAVAQAAMASVITLATVANDAAALRSAGGLETEYAGSPTTSCPSMSTSCVAGYCDDVQASPPTPTKSARPCIVTR